MISIELKAEFRRGSRELVENAVARRISIVLEDSLPGVLPFFLSLELQLLQLLLENGLMRLGWAHAPRMGSCA